MTTHEHPDTITINLSSEQAGDTRQLDPVRSVVHWEQLVELLAFDMRDSVRQLVTRTIAKHAERYMLDGMTVLCGMNADKCFALVVRIGEWQGQATPCPLPLDCYGIPCSVQNNDRDAREAALRMAAQLAVLSLVRRVRPGWAPSKLPGLFDLQPVVKLHAAQLDAYMVEQLDAVLRQLDVPGLDFGGAR